MPVGPRDPKAATHWFQLDYFRRPRTLRRLYGPALVVVLLASGGVAVAAVVSVFYRPIAGARVAFEAGSVSTPHQQFGDRCEVCHKEDAAFNTALRFWPGDAHPSSVGDTACLQCHDAGRHNPHQTDFVHPADSAQGAAGPAQGCVRCHHEHRGDAALARLPDSECTQCHADLGKHGGTGAYQATITRFEVDHPEFGAWRAGKGGLYDPGTIRFSHKAHLDLPAKLATASSGQPAPHWLEENQKQARDLERRQCQYCHKLDAQKRYMLPVVYQDHCAACHPLLPQLNGAWPPAMAEAFLQTPLHHPGPGETAAKVRGELLERFSTLMLRAPDLPPPSADEDVRPFPLQRPLPPLDEKQRLTLGQLVHTERSLFANDPKDWQPLPGFEKRVDFDVKAGCAYCHQEAGRSADGLPLYQPPNLRVRWKDLKFPVDRFDAEAYRFDRNRWYPHARFDHDAHRMVQCGDCHHGTTECEDAHVVLMPAVADCKKCHDGRAGKARSDCLECHSFHDHSQEHPITHEPPALREP
jgi:hypothetical protein